MNNEETKVKQMKKVNVIIPKSVFEIIDQIAERHQQNAGAWLSRAITKRYGGIYKIRARRKKGNPIRIIEFGAEP